MVSISKTKKKTSKNIKLELLNLLKENDDVEEQELNETVNNVNNSQEAIVIIRYYGKSSKHKTKKAKGYIGKQGEFFKKFKDTGNVFDNVGKSMSTIYFKILLYKFLRKHPLLKTSILKSSYF